LTEYFAELYLEGVMRYPKITTLLILGSLLISFNLQAQEKKELTPYERGTNLYKSLGVQVERDLVYKTVDGIELTLDLLLPENEIYKDGAPVVMLTHGGGWDAGDRYHMGDYKYWSDRGIAGVAISYRFLTKNSNGKSYNIGDCVTDCIDATRFVAKIAKKYNLNSNRVAVYGHSAGGHLTLMTALAPHKDFIGDKELSKYSAKIVCAAPAAPVMDLFTPEFGWGNKSKRLIGESENPEETAKRLSPITYIKKDSVPLYITHGDADTAVPVDGTRAFVAKAKELGANVDYLEVSGGDHGMHNKEAQIPGKVLEEKRHEFILKHLTKDLK